MNKILRNVSLAALTAAGTSAAHAANINPISSILSLTAVARADSSGLPPVVDTDTDSQGVTTNPLNASVRAISQDSSAYVESFATGNATWGVNNGAVNLTSIGWITRNVFGGLATVNTGTDWRFQFSSLVNGSFDLSYSVSGTGTDTFGLNGFNFQFADSNGISFDLFFLGDAGVISKPLVAGETYTVTLRNAANIAGGLGQREASMDGRFEWSVQGDIVPDHASTLGLLALGFIGLAGLRRK